MSKRIRPKALTVDEEKELIKDLRDLYLRGISTVLPETREECLTGSNTCRPCPFVSCRYNNYLHIYPDGKIKINTDLEPWEVNPETSCTLDIIDRKDSRLEYERGIPLMIRDDIGAVLSLTGEAIRLCENTAVAKLLKQSILECDREQVEDILKVFGGDVVAKNYRVLVISEEDEKGRVNLSVIEHWEVQKAEAIEVFEKILFSINDPVRKVPRRIQQLKRTWGFKEIIRSGEEG